MGHIYHDASGIDEWRKLVFCPDDLLSQDDTSMVNININSFDNGKGIKEYFLGNIQYEGMDPVNSDVTFEPKHGYWGPIFVNLKV